MNQLLQPVTTINHRDWHIQRNYKLTHYKKYQKLLYNREYRGFRAQRFYLKKIHFFQKTSFCVLQLLLLDFTNMIWQLCINLYTIRIVFERSFQLCILKVANLKKL